MTGRDDYLEPTELERLTARDLAIATQLGRYIERRDRQEPSCADDLLTAAAEFGDGAVEELRTVIALFELLRTDEGEAHSVAD